MEDGPADQNLDYAGGHSVGLARMLCARLCHDLAGTLGALTGTLEMAAGTHDVEALALAKECAHELSARLCLLRAAWGSESEVPAFATLLSGLQGAEKLRLDLSEIDEAAMPAGARQVVACLLILAAQGLPRGGTISMAARSGGFWMGLSGPKANWPETLGRCLHSPSHLSAATGNVRDVSAAVACLIAGSIGLRIMITGASDLMIEGTW